MRYLNVTFPNNHPKPTDEQLQQLSELDPDDQKGFWEFQEAMKPMLPIEAMDRAFKPTIKALDQNWNEAYKYWEQTDPADSIEKSNAFYGVMVAFIQKFQVVEHHAHMRRLLP